MSMDGDGHELNPIHVHYMWKLKRSTLGERGEEQQCNSISRGIVFRRTHRRKWASSPNFSRNCLSGARVGCINPFGTPIHPNQKTSTRRSHSAQQFQHRAPDLPFSLFSEILYFFQTNAFGVCCSLGAPLAV